MTKIVATMLSTLLIVITALNPLLAESISAAPGLVNLMRTYDGSTLDGGGGTVHISSNGRFSTFTSSATKLVPGDENGFEDVFIYDREADSINLVSKSNNQLANGNSSPLAISGDGRFVAFYTLADNLGGAVRTGVGSIYLKDMWSGFNTLLVTDSKGSYVSIADNGKKVAFTVEGNIVVKDLQNDEIIDVTSDRSTNISYDHPRLSANANKLIFNRYSGNPDTNNVMLFNLETEVTTSLTNTSFNYWSTNADISSEGKYASYLQFNRQRATDPAYLYVQNIETGQKIAVKTYNYRDSVKPAPYATALSKDGKKIYYTEQQIVNTEQYGDRTVFKTYLHDLDDNSAVNVCPSNAASCAMFTADSLSDEGNYAVYEDISLESGFSMPYLYVGHPEELVDGESPLVNGNLNSAPNNLGWYKAQTTINWTATDPAPSSGDPTQPAGTLVDQEGDHTYVSGKSCDPAGNCATGSYTVKLDSVAPTAEYDKRNTIPKMLKKTVSGTVADMTSGVAKMEIIGGKRPLNSENGGVTMTCVPGNLNCTWSVKSKDLRGGRHKLTIIVTDNAGNTFTKSKRVIIL